MPEAQQAASASARMDSASSSAHNSSAHSSDTDRELQARPTLHKARSVTASASTWDARTPLGLTARQLQLQGRAHVAVARTRAARGIARDRTHLASHPQTKHTSVAVAPVATASSQCVANLLARRSCPSARTRSARKAQLYQRRRRNRAATMKRIGVGAGAEGRFRKWMTCTDQRRITRNVIC